MAQSYFQKIPRRYGLQYHAKYSLGYFAGSVFRHETNSSEFLLLCHLLPCFVSHYMQTKFCCHTPLSSVFYTVQSTRCKVQKDPPKMFPQSLLLPILVISPREYLYLLGQAFYYAVCYVGHPELLLCCLTVLTIVKIIAALLKMLFVRRVDFYLIVATPSVMLSHISK